MDHHIVYNLFIFYAMGGFYYVLLKKRLKKLGSLNILVYKSYYLNEITRVFFYPYVIRSDMYVGL